MLRVPAQAILVLCFNHAAALSVRRRDLIGDEAGWVDAHTYHALAMRLVGRTTNPEEAQVELSPLDTGGQMGGFSRVAA